MPSSASSRITFRTSPVDSGSSDEVGSSNSSTVGLQRERARDRHALLLAAGHLLRVGERAVAEADAAQQRDGPLDRLALARAARLDLRQHHVLDRGQVREQVEALEDHPDGLAQPREVAADHPRRRRRSARRRPPSAPRSGRSSRFTQRISVVLPPPLEPMMDTIVLHGTSQVDTVEHEASVEGLRESLDAPRAPATRPVMPELLLEQGARDPQPAAAARQQRDAAADLALEPQQPLRERVAEREVQGRDDDVDLERAERLGGDQLALRHQVGGRDRDQQRRRLEQVDEHRVGAGQRRAQRLREDDVRERRPAAQPERLGAPPAGRRGRRRSRRGRSPTGRPRRR